MKRLIIIGEGQTEQSFCNDVLKPYFLKKNIVVFNPTIKKSKGGIVVWEKLKKQIETHLKQDSCVFVTLLIDYYGIKDKHEFPKWNESKTIINKPDRMDFLEKEMYDRIDYSLRNRFIPYIQLHEFEALLFSDKDVFEKSFEIDEFADYNYLLKTISDFSNPEDINDRPDTAPSKRLERIIRDYRKVIYGSAIAQDIGLHKIMLKCPRFKAWIQLLESV